MFWTFKIVDIQIKIFSTSKLIGIYVSKEKMFNNNKVL